MQKKFYCINNMHKKVSDFFIEQKESYSLSLIFETTDDSIYSITDAGYEHDFHLWKELMEVDSCLI